MNHAQHMCFKYFEMDVTGISWLISSDCVIEYIINQKNKRDYDTCMYDMSSFMHSF